jgi:hypothetical protein
MSQAGILDVTSSNPQIPTEFICDVGSAIPIGNQLEILGDIALAGTNPLITSGSGNTVTILGQISDALAAPDSTRVGLSNFDSANFTVDVDGFVSFIGGTGTVNAINVQTGISPVVADGGGAITIDGAVVLAGSNPIRTDGTGANTLAVEVQISQAHAGTDISKIGLSSFDSSSFTVDPNGFVQISGTGLAQTITGDSGGALSPTAGNWDVLGESGFLNTSGAASTLTVNIDTNVKDTAIFSWDGCVLEVSDVTVASDGAIITLSVEQVGGGDLTVVFSDGFYAWDTTPADTVTLTAGTDAIPVLNYVYLLQSTKTLTASTVGFPVAEYAPVATVVCQSAASLVTQGAYKLHAWTNEVKNVAKNGHISHLNFWIRYQNATWVSGVDQTYTVTTNIGTPDNVLLSTVAGVVLQLHTHAFPAFANPHDYYVINDSVTPYTVVTDLNALLTDSNGVSMSGKYFSLVVWGVVSEATGDCKIFVNLPSGSYNNSTGVEQDPSKFAVYTIPSDYVGTGFLISEWKLRHQATSGGTWTSIDEIDLRGILPAIQAGGSNAFPTEFPDSTFRIFDNGDDTKKIAFEASGITTATVRTITMSNYDIDMNTVCISAPTDAGTATPAVGALTFAGGAGISTSGAGSTVTITADGSGPQTVTITLLDDTDSAYTVLTTDYYLSCDVSAGVLVINLANAPTTGRVIIVKDSTGSAASFNITVTTVGGVVTIDGATTFVMNTAYQASSFVFNGTSYEIF